MLVPAFNGLFAPHWRTDARGVLVGLSGSVTRAHIARATLEAVAHQSRELLAAMDAEAGGGHGGELKVDGGMTQNALLMQFQADVTGRRVVRPVVSETTALGAAYAAGLAVGVWKSQAELSAQWEKGAQWEPAAGSEAAGRVARSVRDWERAVARSVNWAIAPDAADPALALLGAGGAAPAPAAARAGKRRAKGAASSGGGGGGAAAAAPRAPSAFLAFCKQQRPSVVAANPGISFAEVGRAMGSAWRQLSDAEKAAFKQA